MVNRNETTKLTDEIADLDDGVGRQGDMETRRPGDRLGDRETRRQGDGFCLSPSVSLSPCLLVCLLVSLSVLCCKSTINPSSNRAGTGVATRSSKEISLPAEESVSAARTNRTRPPSGTASTTSGRSNSRAWNSLAFRPAGGSARNTRPTANPLTSLGSPCASTFPWCMTITCPHRSASSR